MKDSERLTWLRKEIVDRERAAAIAAVKGRHRLAKLERYLAAAKRLTLLRAGERL